jgi:hypothetical protein
MTYQKVIMKLKALNLLIALYVTGCGAQEAAQTASAPSTAPATVQTQPEPPLPAERPTALAAADKAGLPPCDAAHEGELAYVKAEKAFYGCASSWEVIDIKGENGKDGADGHDGKDGLAGTPGKDGVDGKDGQPVAGNIWLDQINGHLWTTSTEEVELHVAQGACTGKWHMPTEDELVIAFARGLNEAKTLVWASTGRAKKPGSAFNTPGTAATYCTSEG